MSRQSTLGSHAYGKVCWEAIPHLSQCSQTPVKGWELSLQLTTNNGNHWEIWRNWLEDSGLKTLAWRLESESRISKRVNERSKCEIYVLKWMTFSQWMFETLALRNYQLTQTYTSVPECQVVCWNCLVRYSTELQYWDSLLYWDPLSRDASVTHAAREWHSCLFVLKVFVSNQRFLSKPPLRKLTNPTVFNR